MVRHFHLVHLFMPMWAMNTLAFCEKAEGQQIAEIQVRGRPRALAFSPDGKLLATTDSGPGLKDVVRVWDLKRDTNHLVVTGLPRPAYHVAFLNARTLVVVFHQRKNDSPGGIIWLVDLDDSTQKKIIHLAGVPITLSDNGRYLVTLPASRAKSVVVHDLASGGSFTIGRHDVSVYVVAIAGKYVATASEDFVIKVWSLPNGEFRWQTTHDAESERLFFTRNGDTLVTATGGAGNYRLWNASSGKEMTKRLHAIGLGDVSSDGEWIVAGFRRRIPKQEAGVQFVSIKKGEVVKELVFPKRTAWFAGPLIRVSPDGRLFAVYGMIGSGLQHGPGGRSSIRVFEMPKTTN